MPAHTGWASSRTLCRNFSGRHPGVSRSTLTPVRASISICNPAKSSRLVLGAGSTNKSRSLPSTSSPWRTEPNTRGFAMPASSTSWRIVSRCWGSTSDGRMASSCSSLAPNQPVRALPHLPGRILQHKVGQHTRIQRGRQVGAEANTNIERPVEVDLDWRTELMHRFAFEADEDGDRIAVLFDADAACHHVGQAAAEAIGHVLHLRAFFRAVGQVDHACAVLADHGFLGVVVEILANDKDGFAVAVAFLVRKADVGGERNVG